MNTLTGHIVDNTDKEGEVNGERVHCPCTKKR